MFLGLSWESKALKEYLCDRLSHILSARYTFYFIRVFESPSDASKAQNFFEISLFAAAIACVDCPQVNQSWNRNGLNGLDPKSLSSLVVKASKQSETPEKVLAAGLTVMVCLLRDTDREWLLDNNNELVAACLEHDETTKMIKLIFDDCGSSLRIRRGISMLARDMRHGLGCREDIADSFLHLLKLPPLKPEITFAEAGN